MFQWFKDRQRIQEIALAGGDTATPERQLQAIEEMHRFLPNDRAFEFLKERAGNSRQVAVRAKVLEILLIGGTERGVRVVLRQMVRERESRPPWPSWRDFGVPGQLRSLDEEAVPSLECHGQLILKQMGLEGYAPLADDAEGLRATLGLIGTARARSAEQRFMSSVSWHKKNSVRTPSPVSIPGPAVRPPVAQPVSRPEPSHARKEDRDEALAQKIKRLLLSASFHDSRDPRAFQNLSGQLAAMGDSIRASGRERWYGIKGRVKQLSGEHFVGMAQYYDLLGDAPPAPSPEPAPIAQPVITTGTACKILFGRRTIEQWKQDPGKTDDWPAFPAPDVAALAALPGQLGKCEFNCWHVIPRHPRPDAEVIQAWSAALGSELETALAGTPVRQFLLHSKETGELSLSVIWDNGASRAQVERVAVAMQTFLGSQ